MITKSPHPGFFQGTEMPTTGWWKSLWPEPANILAVMGLEVGVDALDLCSGDGWFTLPMARVARRAVSVDIDADMLDFARKELWRQGVGNCEFVLGDAYDLPQLVGEQVDFVFMANAFHGVPDRERLTRAVSSILKPGGSFAIVNWHRYRREETTILGEPRGPRSELRVTPTETIEAVSSCGFALVELRDLPPFHYGALFTPVPA